MASTGLLTGRCDPYGAESSIRLLGGVYPESQVGRIMWHCEANAVARFRMTCTGGAYGTRIAPDGGAVAAYHCPGGHRGQAMALCAQHRAEIARRQSEACPRCLYPDEARQLAGRLEYLQQVMQHSVDLGDYARARAEHEQLTAEMTGLRERGLVHKCPLRLTEVS